ncbi:MAG TPA: glycosyltransferase family 1 protein [Pyrinomonadaceae bacterium]|nr:glycosyltransferase family 1 protein [Pyrinomonadaceae bacterium]
MRIGIDGIPLVEPRTGVGHYTFELARAHASLFPSDRFELISPLPLLASVTEEISQQNLRAVRLRLNKLLRPWWAIRLPLYIRQSGLDVFHGTNFDVPLWNMCASVLTIHDLSLFLHSETHEKRLVRRARRRMPLMARTATMIITPSESVRRETCDLLRISPERVVAIPEAARSCFRPVSEEDAARGRRELNVEDDFILFVGTIEPRKNLLTLAKAFAEILRSTPLRPQLVIAGKKGWLTEELFSYLRGTEAGERVRFTGYVRDEALAALYSSCKLSVYPSLYEGFGLPALEAMACGAPLITSRTGALMETVGDAARLFDPQDAEGLAANIKELLLSDAARRELSDKGLKRASQFSWEKTARLTMEVYLEAINRNKAGQYRLR